MGLRFQCIDVRKRYEDQTGGVQALDGVSLTLYDGEISALLGPSGSGKSTLAGVLMGLIPYDSGQILFKETPLERLSMRDFRLRNQMMMQNPYLSVNPRYSVRKILAEPLIVNGRNRSQTEEKIEYWRKTLRLPVECLANPAHKLSAGQLQRVALARALVLDPEFLVLDEPFSSIDEILAQRLLRLFKHLFRRLQIGVFYISHHVSRIRRFADRVILFDHGRVIAERAIKPPDAVGSGGLGSH